MISCDNDLATRIEQPSQDLELEITGSIRSHVSQPTIRPSASETTTDSTIEGSPVSNGSREFELLLKASRVYARANLKEVEMMSVRRSTIQTISSTLSDIALNHMSIISIYRLSIPLKDIGKIGPALTFTSLLASHQATQGGHKSSNASGRLLLHPSISRHLKYVTTYNLDLQYLTFSRSIKSSETPLAASLNLSGDT